MEWTDIKTSVSREYADTAEAIITSVSGGGIYIEDYADMEAQVEEIAHIDLIDEELLQKDRDKVIIHYYLSPDENAIEVTEILKDRLFTAEVPYTMELIGVEQEDWENGWKAYYHAMEIGKRLAICPSWETIETDRKIIKLDPGMAFGTGTHETTSLCLGVLDEKITGGQRMLDIGTGSGILAIGALILGASSADGVDIDPMCVRTARENATLNGVNDNFNVLVGDLSDKATGKYDVICANIVANAIIHLTPAVPVLLKEDGVYITSGIIDTREDEVRKAIEENGFAVQEIRRKNGWSCIIAKLK